MAVRDKAPRAAISTDGFSNDYFLPEAPSAPVSKAGLMSDTGNLLKSGVNQVASGLREAVRQIPVVGDSLVSGADAADKFVTGKTSDEILKGDNERIQGALSDKMRGALDKKWWNSETQSLGDAWTDPRAYAGGIIQSLPGTLLTMIPAGRLAKMAYEAKAAQLSGTMAAEKVAEAAASSRAWTAAIVGGAGEGLLSAGQTAGDIRDELAKLPQSVWDSSDAYKSLIASGMDDASAKAALTNDAATKGFLIAGVTTALFGGQGDRVLANAMSGRIAGGIVKRGVVGMVGEGGEEFGQSYTQEIAKNVGVQTVDPTRQTTEGAFNAALGGLAVGAVQGGGMNALLGRSAPERTAKDAETLSEAATLPVTPVVTPDEIAAIPQAPAELSPREQRQQAVADKLYPLPTQRETAPTADRQLEAINAINPLPEQRDGTIGVRQTPFTDAEIAAGVERAQAPARAIEEAYRLNEREQQDAAFQQGQQPQGKTPLAFNEAAAAGGDDKRRLATVGGAPDAPQVTLRANGQPFATLKAAETSIKARGLSGAVAVSVKGGGFGIRMAAPASAPINVGQANEPANQRIASTVRDDGIQGNIAPTPNAPTQPQPSAQGGSAPTFAGNAMAAGLRDGSGTNLVDAGKPQSDGAGIAELKNEIGWAEQGGRMIRAAGSDGTVNSETISRTKWIPKSDFWPNRPKQGGAITEAQASVAIDKAIAGQPLNARERRFVEYAAKFNADRTLSQPALEQTEKTNETDISEAEYEHYKQTGEPGFGWADGFDEAASRIEALTDDDLEFAASDKPDTPQSLRDGMASLGFTQQEIDNEVTAKFGQQAQGSIQGDAKPTASTAESPSPSGTQAPPAAEVTAHQSAIDADNEMRALDKKGVVVENAEDYFALANKAEDARQAFAREIIESSDIGLSAKTSDGRQLVLNESAQQPGKWQMTRFARDGSPWGDTQFPSKAQAVNEFLREAEISTVERVSGNNQPTSVNPNEIAAKALETAAEALRNISRPPAKNDDEAKADDMRGRAWALVKNGAVVRSGSLPAPKYSPEGPDTKADYYREMADQQGADLYIGGYPSSDASPLPGTIFGMTWEQLNAKQQRRASSGDFPKGKMPSNAVLAYSPSDTPEADRPALDLTNPTESKLRADDAKQKRDAAEKAAKENAPSPEEFGLVGSNRAADVGAAAGQNALFQNTASYGNNAANENEAYATDLFGDPVPSATRAPRADSAKRPALRRDAQPKPALRDTERPDGEYLASTIVGTSGERELGVSRILTAEHAAAATRYLYRSAVERFDAIVTDKNGKPLAVVGGFKGAPTQTAVYPSVVIAEAMRVPGAANIWLSHNHPSGSETLSNADIRLESTFSDALRGSGIQHMGLLAVAGDRRYSHVYDGNITKGESRGPGSATISVPVIERELADNRIDKVSVNAPDIAKQVARDFYEKSNGPGIILLDAQHKLLGWMAITPNMYGALRGKSGGLNAIYRALSHSGAVSGIIAHGGELDARIGDIERVTASQNIAAALSKVDVSPLDSINVKTGKSVAMIGDKVADGPLFSRSDTIEVDGQQRPRNNSNGKPIAATDEGIRNFWRWFGSSKVVDEQGRPLVVYHGTNQDIDAFRADRLGQNTSAISATGFYFSEESREAAEYADMSARKQVSNAIDREAANARFQKDMDRAIRRNDFDAQERITLEWEASEQEAMSGEERGANILPVFLSINNPMVVDMHDRVDLSKIRNAIEIAKLENNDGIKLVNVYDPVGDRPEGFSTTQWIAFKPNQIKSATGNTGAFSPENADIRFSREAPLWRSTLTEAIGKTSFAQAPADQWKAWLNANAAKLGVKKDEIEWSGVTDWLDLQTGKVTRDQVQQYLDANGVKVTESTLADGEYEPTFVEQDDDGMWRVYGERANEGDVYDTAEQANAKSEEYNADIPAGPSKYSSYQLPGGTNYRELLLTLPTRDQAATDADAETRRIREEGGRAYRGEMNKSDFKSSHWDQPNILAHIRFNERTDADGKRVLFLEEIQSDWGQAAKKSGVKKYYAPSELAALSRAESIAEFGAQRAELFWHIKAPDNIFEIAKSRYQTADEALAYVAKEKPKNSGGVPDAPMIGKTEAWVSLALKRMIRYAVDNGFDRVAMVNGEQSAERYDLSKQVEEVAYNKNDTMLRVVSNDGRVVINEKTALEKLPDILGKEVAEKIVQSSSTFVRMTGLDLKVGGEGMKAFYDRIVPQVANDVLKKLGGGKLGVVELQIPGQEAGERDAATGAIVGPNGTRGKNFDAAGFDITDKMREHAAQGMPLFRRDEQQPTATNTHAADVIAKAAKTVNIPLDVYATPQEASAKLGIDIPSDARGLFYKGRAALISSNITSPRMAEFVLWHELLHAGITLVAPRYGNEYNRIMQDLAMRNTNIVKAARDWRNSYGEETIQRSMDAGLSREQADKRMRLMAIEEALADLAGSNAEIKGWSQFVAKLQALLRSMGGFFDNLANWIEGKTQAETLQLIARTRDAITSQDLQITTQVPAFAREDEPTQSRATNDGMANDKTVVGNTTGRSADDALPGHYDGADVDFRYGGNIKELLAEIAAKSNEQTTSQDGDVAFSRTGNGDIFDKNATDAQSTYNGTEAVQGIGASVKNVMRQTINIARDKRGAALSFLGGRQIADIYSKDVPELPKYNEILQRMQAEQNEGSAVADSIIEKWRVINRKRPEVATQLSSLMHDSTLAQVDPDVSADNAELRKRWINLPQEAKDIYREARDAYVVHFEKVKAELIDRVERSALDTSAKNRTLASMREEFTKAMKGVYFPLARFGDYMVVVKDKAGVTQSVSMAETTNQAQALRAELLRAYPDYVVGAIQKKKEFNAERDGVSRGFMKDLVALISEEPDAQTRDSQLDAINQLWLSSLPDLSWAKSGIHRKGTPGYSNDAMRAFARNMFHGGYHLAKLRYGDRLGDTLAQMQETIDNKVRSNPEYSNVVAQSVVDEMNARHKHVMNPQNTPVANALTGLGFMWHMGLSPASAVVNLSQTALVAYPMLASKFGFGKAATMLLSLSADAVKGKNDLLSQLQGAEKDAYDRAVREGLIDVTMAHDLAGVSQGKSGEFNEKQQRVMRVASVMFHEAEKFNRGVTFMSAYRLAVQSGVSDPYKLAHDLTFDSHFDYSSQNRPRVMQGPTARVILLFKQYGQNMIYTLSRNTFKALQGDREAQKTLAGLLAMHGMFAGALGLPLMTTLLAAASAIGGSDDEPWDAQVALRNYLADVFGKDIGEVLAHGVFRAPGIKDAIGADISGRVGLDSMLIRMPQETLEGKKYYQALLETIAGPVFGIGGNIANGMQTMAQGNTLRGIEEMLPKSIKDPLKAYRYEQDGIQDKTGITIVDETTIPEEVAQFLGFSPARGMEGFEGKSAIKNQETLLTQRRRQLMQRYGKDAEEGDTADSLTAIQRWNIANPTMAIKGQDLLRSMREKAKRQAEAENGAYLSKKRRGLAELGEFANAE